MTHTRNSIKLEQRYSSSHYSKVWEVEESSKTLYASCNDRKQLKETFSWTTAKQNEAAFADLREALQRHKDKIYKVNNFPFY